MSTTELEAKFDQVIRLAARQKLLNELYPKVIARLLDDKEEEAAEPISRERLREIVHEEMRREFA